MAGFAGACVACCGARAQDVCFRLPGETLGPAAWGNAFAPADLNGDGVRDVVWGSTTGLSIAISRGHLGFAPTVVYPDGCCPGATAAGDFNGDGASDIADVGGEAGHLGIRFNLADGEGTLGARIELGTLVERDRVAAGDLNGDGFDDIVVDDPVAGFFVYFGRADDGFDAGPTVPMLNRVISLTVVDADMDGDMDVIAPIVQRRRIQIAFNAGNGTFPTISQIPTNSLSPSSTIADFTGDGAADIVAVDRDNEAMQVFANNGSGEFSALAPFPVDGWMTYFTHGRMLGSDAIDIAAIVEDLGTRKDVMIFEGDGSGGFALAKVSRVGTTIMRTMTVGDVTADGGDDLLVTTLEGLLMLPSRGGSGPVFPDSYEDYRQPVIGDFTGDGLPDAAVLAPGLFILPGDGEGSFGAPMPVALNGGAAWIGAAHFDGDGSPDILALVGDDATVVLNNGDGTFGAPIPVTLNAGARSLATGDLNGDGLTDFVGAGWTDGPVTAVLNDGVGGFSVLEPVLTGDELFDVAVGDVNGDNVNDVAVATRALQAWAYFVNTGEGVLSGPTIVPASDGSAVKQIEVADIDLDGLDDVALAMSYEDFSGQDRNAVLFNRGGGAFQEVSLDADLGAPEVLSVTDFDNNGLPDLASSHDDFYKELIAVYPNRGGRAFDAPRVILPGYSPKAFATGDLNLDAQPDLLVGVIGDTAEVAAIVSLPPCGAQCAPDMNGDGDVNTQDVLLFLNLWAAQDSKSDWDENGVIDTRDFLAFLNDWVAGC